MDLAVRQEKTLFNINLIVAVIAWLIIIFGTFGIGLLYVLGGLVFYLFVHSAFIAYIKGNAVLISADQFPDLYARVQKACEKLKMKAPAAYLMNGNGVMNAFATKFMRNYYIVLNSDVIDSFSENDSAIDFYIGHELGHIHRKHLVWWPIFLPVTALPLLMPAYRRACETTCDRYGRFCAETKEDAVRGLSLLAAGGKRWKSMSPASYMAQAKDSGGFWMSFHEITGSYPWLSKRVALVQDGDEARFPGRHAGAWVMGFFCPGFLAGAFFPFLAFYAILIIAVIAIPNFMKFQEKVKAAAAQGQTRSLDVKNTSWKNPANGKVFNLPEGFSTIQLNTKNNMIVGQFTNNPDLMIEQLLWEKSQAVLDFKLYVDALWKQKQKLVAKDVKLTDASFRTVNGIEVAEFSFDNVNAAGVFKNTIRAWSPDGKNFWYVISTTKSDSAESIAASENFLHFLLDSTKG